MPVQFPTFSTQEQTDRSTNYAKNTLFPYTFAYRAVVSSTFTRSALGGAWSYFTLGFKADNNLAVSNLEVGFSLALLPGLVDINTLILVEVSYAPVLDEGLLNLNGVPALPTSPSDTGNIIFRRMEEGYLLHTATSTQFLSGYNFNRLEPYNYLLKFNQILYMHVAVNVEVVATNSVANGVFIFHTLPTGAKT